MEGRKRFPPAMFTSLEPDHLGQAQMMVHGNGRDNGETLGEHFGTAHSHKTSTCSLAGSRLPLGHAVFSHTLYLLLIALSLMIPHVITTYSVPAKHQMYSGSYQEVSSSLATEMKCEIC